MPPRRVRAHTSTLPRTCIEREECKYRYAGPRKVLELPSATAFTWALASPLLDYAIFLWKVSSLSFTRCEQATSVTEQDTLLRSQDFFIDAGWLWVATPTATTGRGSYSFEFGGSYFRNPRIECPGDSTLFNSSLSVLCVGILSNLTFVPSMAICYYFLKILYYSYFLTIPSTLYSLIIIFPNASLLSDETAL